MPERLMTPDEVAELWGVSAKTVRRLVSAGDVQHVRIGRLIRIPESEVSRRSQPKSRPVGVPRAPRLRRVDQSPTDLLRAHFGAA